MTSTRRGILAAASALLAAPAVAQPSALRELRIGYQKTGLLYIDKQRGLIENRFRQQNVAVRWVEFTFGPPLLEALAVGSIDYGTVGDAPPIFAQAAGANLLYVAVEEAAGSGSGILVPPGSTLQRLEELRGKRVGFARASSAHALTIAALDKAGVAWSDITPVQLPPADARAAFERGALDAWTIWDPFFALAEGRPGVRTLASASDIARQNSFYLANRDFVNRHPAAVAAVNEELARTAAWCEANRAEVARVLSEASGIELPAWERAIARREFSVGPVTPRVVEEQQRVADRFRRLNLIPRDVRIADIVWPWRIGA
ncbi:sulfonate ABC transporter substrate-binding protein [Falsiroseomonas sp. HW251]|uniref:sulfonate ABC transporter substrate-binding protein n=1 Tax=Falsiroseomonas sp. HW251 TaxID=3390998 RepID=UPI003D312444